MSTGTKCGGLVVGGVIALLFALVTGTALVAGVGAVAVGVAAAACTGPAVGPGGGGDQVGDRLWSGEQLANAHLVVTTAVRRALPRRAAVIAVSAAIVESGLRNRAHGDLDSLGLFQQRPSQGWGSPEDLLNPTYATGKFYDHLIALPGWAGMQPGAAAQAVQRSAHPERYAAQEPPAGHLVDRSWQGPDNPPTPGTPWQADFGGCPDQGGSNLPVDPTRLPPGFRLPNHPQRAAAVSYALAQLGKPYVWGATGPDAFDCSGLVQAAWAHAGVALSRTTFTQAHDGAPVTSLHQAQPGDLLFIPGATGTTTQPGHVGMYAGHGVVVNAYDSDHGVILETLGSWAGQVVAIRSPVAAPAEGGARS